MPFVSGSLLALLRQCAYPARDDLAPPPREEPGRAAIVGTAAHARIAAALGLAEPLLDGLTDDERVTVSAQTIRAQEWLAQRALTTSATPEVAYAYDVIARRARRLQPRHARDYSDVDRTREIPCTLDVIAVLDPSRALVIDWKTGRSAHVEPARDNAQLLLGALCARSHYGVSEVEVGIVYLGDGSEPARYSSAVVSDLELDAFAEELARLLSAIPAAEPRPGAHCTERYCRRLGQCPATSSTLVDVGQPEDAGKWPVVVDPSAIVSRAHAAWLLRAAKMASAVAAKAESAVRAYTESTTGTLDLGDGRVYGPEPGPSRIDTRRALLVLMDEGLDLDIAAPRSTSRDSIGEALRARGGEPISTGVKRIVARIDAEGGMVSGGERWSIRKA